MADGYDRGRVGRDDRGPMDRAGDEVRSWLGDDDAARRRHLDEQARDRWEADTRSRWADDQRERWRSGSRWGYEGSYSSDREYGDGGYGWRGGNRDNRSAGMTERDYGWREPASWRYPGGTDYRERPYAADTGYTDYGRESYGGPYGRERYGAREWSSTEGWRVPGPHAGRGPRGFKRSDERIRDDINERLTAHGLIDATEVECRVVNGEVTLTGFVDSRAAKRAAEDLAEDVYGVREVHNELRVRSHAADDGVGRTSVLGLTEAQLQTHPSTTPPATEAGRPRTRT